MWWACIKNSFLSSIVAFAFLSSCTKSGSNTSKIYLASSFAPLDDSIRALIDEPIDLMFLSSSAIAKHIEQGAPCEIAVLADENWRDYLARKKLIAKEQDVIATNSLVLARVADAPVEPLVRALAKINSQQKLVIGDPDFVPLGAYTKEALLSLGVYEQLMPHFIRASSARQATVLLEQRAAPYAILYRSDAHSGGFSIIATIESHHHRPIRYSLVVCQNARRQNLASLRRAFSSDRLKAHLKDYGFN